MLKHFSIDPRLPAHAMARFDGDGVHLQSHTYFLTGNGFIIPANGGGVVALLCHVPAYQHSVNEGRCALLKHGQDPWYISTALYLTNTSPTVSLCVPAQCDIYALIKNTSVTISMIDDECFYGNYTN